MDTKYLEQSFMDRLREAYPDLTKAEIVYVYNGYHYSSSESTDRIGSDLNSDSQPDYHRALTGRYWLCQMLHDEDFWYDHHDDFLSTSGNLPHEPAVIATALALQPTQTADWDAVEKWSWVYRHAMMSDVDFRDFEVWCAGRRPDSSRAVVLAELMRAGHIAALSSEDGPTIFDAANGNA